MIPPVVQPLRHPSVTACHGARNACEDVTPLVLSPPESDIDSFSRPLESGPALQATPAILSRSSKLYTSWLFMSMSSCEHSEQPHVGGISWLSRRHPGSPHPTSYELL